MSISALMNRLLGGFFHFLSRRLTGISVLMYHSISTADTLLAVSPEAFEEQMSYINKRGFRTLFASEVPMFISEEADENFVCVTFDDGCEDMYTTAFPILKRYGIKATVFLTTGSMGAKFTTSDNQEFSLLSEKEVREMVQSGLVECMPHTHTHPELSSSTTNQIREELNNSRHIIENITGRPANVFAYPKGKESEEVIALLREQHYIAAFGVQPGIVRPSSDIYRLPRNAVFPTHNFTAFRLKLSDSLERFTTVKAWIKKI